MDLELLDPQSVCHTRQLTTCVALLNVIIGIKVLVTSKKDTFFFSKVWSSLLLKYK